jgi:hypothetical protein
MPTHGEERNRRIETESGPAEAFKTPDGRVVYYGPTSSMTQTVCERWCSTCGEWVRAAGIIGNLFCGKCSTEWSRPVAKEM